MAQEIIFGSGREFSLDAKTGEVVDGEDLDRLIDGRTSDEPGYPPIWRRGVLVQWDRETGLVNLGVGPIHLGSHGMHDAGHFTELGYHELRDLIRKLQKIGRQSFGPDPW